jgi:NAD(P)-dependent dehydrogenase (short-subunit alcohol dehydrogenase family)
MRLKDKIIFVSGANGLLGREIVQRIKEEEGMCISADINLETDIEAATIQCDITDEVSVKQAIDTVCQEYGRIDGVVNTAYPRTKDWGNKFELIEVESWRKNIDMQLNSVFLLSRAALEKMKDQRKGVVINLSSIYGIVGPDFSVYEGTSLTMPAAYAAIKGGIINFTKYLASYYGPHNLRVNCVSPGGIFDQQPERFVQNYEQKVPMRRMGLPADIAGPVCFLLSDESSYITGHNLVVDGGWTII